MFPQTDEKFQDIFSPKLIKNLQLQMRLTKLKRRLTRIQNDNHTSYAIDIEGYRFLRSTPGEHWTNCINTMFIDAGLPTFYILNMSGQSDNFDDITTITVELISFPVKMYVKKRLLHFLQCQHKEDIIKII
jgi:hypothetical protein